MSSDVQIILGNSNKRFSGVTSTMLQVLDKQRRLAKIAVLGAHHLPENMLNDIEVWSFADFVKHCRTPLADGSYRIFHARRNDEMIQALVARALGAKIKIAFTSTAQRNHSRFSRWLMSRMDGIISTCTAAASYLRHKPDIIVPHGVDTALYHPPELPDGKQEAWQALGFTGDYGIGMFGRVRHSKGVDLLVEAAVELLPLFPGATVIIGGQCLPADRTYQQSLKEQIQNAGLEDRVLFIGEQPFERLPLLFRGMSIVAALSRSEGFGLTPLEAMASGCAVLTSRAGAWPDIIEDGVTGYTTSTGNLGEIKVALTFMMQNIEAAYEMGEEGRRLVESQYSVDTEAQKLTDYLLGLSRPDS